MIASKLILRPYRPGDAAPTLKVFERAIQRTASRDYTEAQINAWARSQDSRVWASQRAAANTWVAETDGVVVGFTDIDSTGYIDMMFIDPDRAGNGIAGRLLRHVLNLARSQRATTATVNASITARPFFERHGFSVVAEQHPERNGVTFTNYRMFLDLVPPTPHEPRPNPSTVEPSPG